MVEELVRHLFPRAVPSGDLRLRYTFCLGGLAFTCLLVLAGTGLLLLFYYSPSPAAAHDSIQMLERDVWGGAYLRSVHRIASHALLLLLALHTLRVILTGAFQRPRKLNWVLGCALLLLSVFEAYTGYLLPMDQLAYWATETGMALLRSLPAGGALRAILVPDRVGGPLSLLRFFALHVAVIPLALLALSMLHFFVIRRQKGLLPYL
jgi:quinol-cytochrome oxidoreductase complex cytochrome b subunit